MPTIQLKPETRAAILTYYGIPPAAQLTDDWLLQLSDEELENLRAAARAGETFDETIVRVIEKINQAKHLEQLS